LPLPVQVLLLQVIRRKRVRKVGATEEQAVDVRILSATHPGLAALAEWALPPRPVHHRLNVIELKMPPLREC
jgi:two-component system response regulator PilR (NtrC family)